MVEDQGLDGIGQLVACIYLEPSRGFWVFVSQQLQRALPSMQVPPNPQSDSPFNLVVLKRIIYRDGCYS